MPEQFVIIDPPDVLTKSQSKALGCELFYAHHYMVAEAAVKLVESRLASTGTQFHLYRARYTEHLMIHQVRQDADWVREWLNANAVSEEARELIERDIMDYSPNLDRVLAAEILLSVDRNFEPVDYEEWVSPGLPYEDNGAYMAAIIDLLELDGASARVIDCKSGWSTSPNNDHEAPHIARLVFAHFPQVTSIDFVYEFIRVRADVKVHFTREDIPWIEQMMEGTFAHRADVARRFRAGKKLLLDPFAGLCGFCLLKCPLKEAVAAGIVDAGPLQNKKDAVRIAQRLFIAQNMTKVYRDLLKAWVDENGPLECGNDVVADFRIQNNRTLPLPDVAELLGLRVLDLTTLTPEQLHALPAESPEVAQKWNIQIPKVLVRSSSLTGYAKAKMRKGMQEAMNQIGTTKPKSVLKIHRVSIDERLESLGGGDDEY